MVFKDDFEKGSWIPKYFFPENGTVSFALYSDDKLEKNQIIGGKLNAEYLKFQNVLFNKYQPMFKPLNDSASALDKRNEFFSPEMMQVLNDLQAAKDDETRLKLINKKEELRATGAFLSTKGKANFAKNDSVLQDLFNWRYNYIEHNPNLVSYFFLVQDVQSIKSTKAKLIDIKRNYVVLSNKFPDHPYTKLINTLLESNSNIKVGGHYIDFKLPDLDGKIITLSDVIKDKVALIDLWASWCGPCIMTSKSMIPIYEEFKDKGFTICGVAAEIKNTDQMKIRIEKEKFLWINLVDLDHKNQIWDKYGISNAGGGTFLIDRDGKILAVNPTANEVRNILTDKLK